MRWTKLLEDVARLATGVAVNAAIYPSAAASGARWAAWITVQEDALFEKPFGPRPASFAWPPPLYAVTL
jgi:hypothetical protein